jgi:hypothetical protein
VLSRYVNVPYVHYKSSVGTLGTHMGQINRSKIENRKVVYPDAELLELLEGFKSRHAWMDSDSKLFVTAMKYYLGSVWDLKKEDFTVEWLPREWKGRHTGKR